MARYLSPGERLGERGRLKSAVEGLSLWTMPSVIRRYRPIPSCNRKGPSRALSWRPGRGPFREPETVGAFDARPGELGRAGVSETDPLQQGEKGADSSGRPSRKKIETGRCDLNAIERIAARFATPIIRWVALLGLCAAYLQGGIVKASDLSGAIAEMQHFGLAPAAPLALAVIALELGASVMILAGFYRWLAALALAAFTLMATLIALRFWELPAGHDRFIAENAFFEHLGLVGGFVLVAWEDVMRRSMGGANEPAKVRRA